jgi:hypothetical protein
MHDLDTPVPKLTSLELAQMEARFAKLNHDRGELRSKLLELDSRLLEAHALLALLRHSQTAAFSVRSVADQVNKLLGL